MYSSMRQGERRFDVLIADEVDSLTIDQIDSFTQLSQPLVGSESLLSLLVLIQKQLDLFIAREYPVDYIKARLLDWFESLIANPVELKKLNVIITDELKAFVQYQLPNWIESAISARKDYQEDRDYLVHTN